MKLTLAILLLLSFGCRAQIQRQYFETHPEAPAHLVALIQAHKIEVGMDSDAVRASWGLPDRIIQGATGDAWDYTFCISGNCSLQIVYFDAAGKVLDWTVEN